MRSVIYARFSSDLQDTRSLADQISLANSYIAARGLTLAGVYEDAAISGASTLNRPGIQRLLVDAKAGRFDVIVTESLDRLSRSQADIAGLYERLSFLGVRIETLADGHVTEIHVGLKGTMAALFLKDLAQKTRRGQIGRVKAGRIPGGKSYGYDILRTGEERGRRTVNGPEAEVVRRAFREYAAGKSPLSIVHDFNAEGIKSPRGGRWNASALLGSPRRGNGLLNNELYHGVIVYKGSPGKIPRANGIGRKRRTFASWMRSFGQRCRNGARSGAGLISTSSAARNVSFQGFCAAPIAAAGSAS